MPDKRRLDPLTLAFAFLVILLFLKALGILQAIFNIDPMGVTLSFDIGYLTSAGLFILLWRKVDKVEERLTSQGERIAKMEGTLGSFSGGIQKKKIEIQSVAREFKD